MSHLLSLAALHAAASGAPDKVFGPDGDVPGAPLWAGPLTNIADPRRHGWLVWRGALHVSVATADGHWPLSIEDWRERWALDLRVPSVAAWLAGILHRAMITAGSTIDNTVMDVLARAMWATARPWAWKDGHAIFLAQYVLLSAKDIAALGGTRG